MRLIAPIQQIRVNKRKQWIIAGGVVFGSLWLMLVFWLMTAEKTTVGPAPSQVAVRSASPTLSTTPTVNVQMPQYSPLKPISYSQPARHTSVLQMPMSSGATMTVYTTSSAKIKSIGGGGASSGGSGGSSSRGNRGISNSAVAYTGAIYIPVVSNAVTAVGASRANDLASTTLSDESTQGSSPRAVSGNPHGPFPDPVGDIAWGMMALLALVYARTIYIRRRRAQSENK